VSISHTSSIVSVGLSGDVTILNLWLNFLIGEAVSLAVVVSVVMVVIGLAVAVAVTAIFGDLSNKRIRLSLHAFP
jgi:hypothetical protein